MWEEREEGGRRGDGGCVMAVGGWTPLESCPLAPNPGNATECLCQKYLEKSVNLMRTGKWSVATQCLAIHFYNSVLLCDYLIYFEN